MLELRPIERFPGYSAGSDGRIYTHLRQCGRNRAEIDKSYLRALSITLVGSRKNNMYCAVNLRYSTNKFSRQRSHVLICSAFHGKAPVGAVARHLDGDRMNNLPANLAWGTRSENFADGVRHGTMGRGLHSVRGRFRGDPDGLAAFFTAINLGIRRESIATCFGISLATVSNILSGRTY